MSKALAIICIILGVILLAGFAFGVYVLLEATNYCKNWATDFWVTVEDNRYYVDSNELVMSDTDVDVHYLVDWLSQKRGYTYKVVPAGNDFGYTVDGAVYNWLSIDDLTAAFEVTERDNGFTVKAHGKTITDILQTLYPNGEIVSYSENEGYNYQLIITSVDGKSVALTFRCAVAVDGIELDPPSIAF